MLHSPAALAAVAHRNSLGTQHIDVPQWLVDGQPLRVYWTPMTVGEAAKLAEYRGSPEGDVHVLIEKARDAEGKPLFTIADKPLLLMDVSWHVVAGLALLMCARPSVDDVEKK